MHGPEPPVAPVTTTNDDICWCTWFTGGTLCGKAFATFDDLITHLNRVHGMCGPAARRLVCRWLTDRGCCDRELRRHAFKRHISAHLGRTELCIECGKPFSRRDSMRAHFKRKHGKK